MFIKPHGTVLVPTFSRRRALSALGALPLVGCGGGADSLSSASSSSSTTSSSSSSASSSASSSSAASSSINAGSCTLTAPSCVVAPTETLGPYFAFTNGVVTLTSLWRQDITSDPTGTYSQRTGVPLEIILKLVNVNDNCAPLAGYDIYVWHCDADGYYSYYPNQPGYLGAQSYSGGYFLRGVQTSDSCGEVTFNTVFPGWYTGRYTHLHIAVSLGATSEAVTQMTWPASVITDVYTNAATSYGAYTAHGANPTTFAADMVFAGDASQIATTTGSIAAGYQSQWVLGITL